MTICLGKSCPFSQPFVNVCYVFMSSSFPFGFEDGLWNVIALTTEYWLSPYLD